MYPYMLHLYTYLFLVSASIYHLLHLIELKIGLDVEIHSSEFDYIHPPRKNQLVSFSIADGRILLSMASLK